MEIVNFLGDILNTLAMMRGRIIQMMSGTLTVILTLEIVMMGYMMAVGKLANLKEVIWKAFQLMVMVWIFTKVPQFADFLVRGMMWAGSRLAGVRFDEGMLRSPGTMFDQIVEAVVKPTWAATAGLGIDLFRLDVIGMVIMAWMTALVVTVAFGYMMIRMYLAYAEYFLSTSFALIVWPFTLNTHLRFLGERGITAILGNVFKLGMLYMLMGMMLAFFQRMAQGMTRNTITAFVEASMASVGAAALAHTGPALAMGFIGGSPQLSLQEAGKAVAATIGGAVKLGAAGVGAPAAIGSAAAATGEKLSQLKASVERGDAAMEAAYEKSGGSVYHAVKEGLKTTRDNMKHFYKAPYNEEGVRDEAAQGREQYEQRVLRGEANPQIHVNRKAQAEAEEKRFISSRFGLG